MSNERFNCDRCRAERSACASAGDPQGWLMWQYAEIKAGRCCAAITRQHLDALPPARPSEPVDFDAIPF